MNIEITEKEFRLLLDLVYVGNWVLNSARGDDRIEDYDKLESKLFRLCRGTGMDSLCEVWRGIPVPSQAFVDGGIQEAIMDYEDSVFFDILAEELARRDMGYPDVTQENLDELNERMDKYLDEFDVNGADRLVLETE